MHVDFMNRHNISSSDCNPMQSIPHSSLVEQEESATDYVKACFSMIRQNTMILQVTFSVTSDVHTLPFVACSLYSTMDLLVDNALKTSCSCSCN